MEAEGGCSTRGSLGVGEAGRDLFLLYLPERRGGGDQVDEGAEVRGMVLGRSTGGGRFMSWRLIEVLGVPGMSATNRPGWTIVFRVSRWGECRGEGLGFKGLREEFRCLCLWGDAIQRVA